MKVSIIVPVYNAEKYLKDALDSLVNQTLKDIEIICVNDGSTDNSLEILKSYAQKDERVKIISQANRGQSSARNAGLKIAKGEYIGFLDADDWVERFAFEDLYSNATNTDISICAITSHSKGIKNTKDPYLSAEIFPKSFEQKTFTAEDCKDFLFRISVTPVNKIYKREFLKQNNIIFKEGVIFEDNIFFLETFIHANSIKLSKKNLYNYRIDNTTSCTHGRNDLKKLDIFSVIKEQERIFKASKYYNKEMFELHKKSTLYYWYKKITNPNVKFLYWLKMIKIYPSFTFGDLFKDFRIKKTLRSIPKESVVWFEENSQKYLENIFQKTTPHFKGFVSNNNQQQLFLGLKIFNADELPENTLFTTISSTYYNWGKQINSKLEKKYKFKNIILPLW